MIVIPFLTYEILEGVFPLISLKEGAVYLCLCDIFIDGIGLLITITGATFPVTGVHTHVHTDTCRHSVGVSNVVGAFPYLYILEHWTCDGDISIRIWGIGDIL